MSLSISELKRTNICIAVIYKPMYHPQRKMTVLERELFQERTQGPHWMAIKKWSKNGSNWPKLAFNWPKQWQEKIIKAFNQWCYIMVLKNFYLLILCINITKKTLFLAYKILIFDACQSLTAKYTTNYNYINPCISMCLISFYFLPCNFLSKNWI